MPTGYTAAIGDNPDLTFPEFAWNCARAMGACIMQRDDPSSDAPDLDEKPSDHHAVAWGKAKAELKRLESLSDDEMASERSAHVEVQCIALRDASNKDDRLAAAYRRMLDEVKRWEPPTAEHSGLQSFMKDQLTESLRFGCGGTHYKEQLRNIESRTPADWHQHRIELARNNVAYQEKSYTEEVERVRGRNEWKRQLGESLGIHAEPATA